MLGLRQFAGFLNAKIGDGQIEVEIRGHTDRREVARLAPFATMARRPTRRPFLTMARTPGAKASLAEGV